MLATARSVIASTLALAMVTASPISPAAAAPGTPASKTQPTTSASPSSTAPHGYALERDWAYTGDLEAPHLIAVTPQGDVFVGGTDDKIRNAAEEAQGKVKEAAGKATDDERLEAEGKADQTKANLKQAGEKVKDAFQ